ncbi:uncharacterized protein [Montipora capricornis]|uniref:uncharacterized protein n=1 Tax=Montipora capricornis TaxID=246305 RepID=UPI0035F15FEF
MMIPPTLSALVFLIKLVSSRKCVEETLYCTDPVSAIFKIGNFSCCNNSEHGGALKFLSDKLLVCIEGELWGTLMFKGAKKNVSEFNSEYSCKDVQYKNGDGVYWLRLKGTENVFPVYCDMVAGGWTMVFKIVGGLHGSEVSDAYDFRLPIAEYVRAALQVNVSDEHKGHYKNRLATDWAWGNFIPSQVRVALFESGSLVKELVFGVAGSSWYTWFSADTLISSSWPDLKNEKQDQFSIKGSCTFGTTDCDTFVINRDFPNCANATGWIMITRGPPQCDWKNATTSYRYILYSKGSTYAKWASENEVGVADVLAVFLR